MYLGPLAGSCHSLTKLLLSTPRCKIVTLASATPNSGRLLVSAGRILNESDEIGSRSLAKPAYQGTGLQVGNYSAFAKALRVHPKGPSEIRIGQ